MTDSRLAFFLSTPAPNEEQELTAGIYMQHLANGDHPGTWEQRHVFEAMNLGGAIFHQARAVNLSPSEKEHFANGLFELGKSYHSFAIQEENASWRDMPGMKYANDLQMFQVVDAVHKARIRAFTDIIGGMGRTARAMVGPSAKGSPALRQPNDATPVRNAITIAGRAVSELVRKPDASFFIRRFLRDDLPYRWPDDDLHDAYALIGAMIAHLENPPRDTSYTKQEIAKVMHGIADLHITVFHKFEEENRELRAAGKIAPQDPMRGRPELPRKWDFHGLRIANELFFPDGLPSQNRHRREELLKIFQTALQTAQLPNLQEPGSSTGFKRLPDQGRGKQAR